MAEVTAQLVKQLRDRTSVAMMDAKKALVENNGDIDQAIEWLRKRGIMKAQAKTERVASQGVIEPLIESDAHTATMIELNCETDFVARTEEFKALAKELVKLAAERDGLGVGVFSGEHVEEFLKSPYSPSKTIGEYITEVIAKTGENIVLRRFTRLHTANGVIEPYVHLGGKIGVLVELESAGGTAEKATLVTLAHDIAMHAAAMRPEYLDKSEIPEGKIEEERRVAREQMKDKPANVIDKIVENKVNKYAEETCLVHQPFIRDPSLSISQLIEQAGKKTGSTIKINRYVRFEVGAA